MAHSEDWQTDKQTTINWESEAISPEEQSMLKTLHPLQAEYADIVRMAYHIGSRVTSRRMAHADPGSDSSHHIDKRDKTAVVKDMLALKLAAITRYLYHNGLQVGKGNFIFKCYATGFLQKGYRINSVTAEVELNNEIISLDDLYTDSYLRYLDAMGFDLTPRPDFISRVLCHLAEKKGNPWLDCMSKLSPVSPEAFLSQHGFDPHRMAEYITGDNGDLVQDLWLYQFIGSMMRTFTPGCKHDHMLILISAEKGLRKTTFLEKIAKLPTEKIGVSKYYIQLRTLKSQKADQERLKGKMIVNLDECDSAFRGLNSDDLKEVVTASTDNYRSAYATAAKDHPRSCTLFGTTNTIELIQDLKGDRRFFPVQVGKMIDTDWVTENWSSFWGFYLWCYQEMTKGNTKYRNWLSKPEEAALGKLQCAFKASTPWLETVEGILEILEDTYPAMAIKASDILAVIGKETGTAKAHMSESIKSLLATERGYLEGRPRLADGSQTSRPILYRDGTNEAKPILITRMMISNAYTHLCAGTYILRIKEQNAENIETSEAVLEQPDEVVQPHVITPFEESQPVPTEKPFTPEDFDINDAF